MGFNPRARAGRDGKKTRATGRKENVSIHAPARGATTTITNYAVWGTGFNPRARAGRDRVGCGIDVVSIKFQSTRPRGARRGNLDNGLWTSSFNPRARAGRDLLERVLRLLEHCFNPRARAGRDLLVITVEDPGVVFQSTRPRGARRTLGPLNGVLDLVSIHAPARGATFD